MVFAVGLERDVLEQDNLVIAADLFERAAEMVRRIFPIAARIFAPGAGDAPRCIEQPLAGRIVAGPADQGADRLGHIRWDVTSRRGFDEVAVLWIAVVSHC